MGKKTEMIIPNAITKNGDFRMFSTLSKINRKEPSLGGELLWWTPKQIATHQSGTGLLGEVDLNFTLLKGGCQFWLNHHLTGESSGRAHEICQG
jgi:hypothetical protein